MEASRVVRHLARIESVGVRNTHSRSASTHHHPHLLCTVYRVNTRDSYTCSPGACLPAFSPALVRPLLYAFGRQEIGRSPISRVVFRTVVCCCAGRAWQSIAASLTRSGAVATLVTPTAALPIRLPSVRRSRVVSPPALAACDLPSPYPTYLAFFRSASTASSSPVLTTSRHARRLGPLSLSGYGYAELIPGKAVSVLYTYIVHGCSGARSQSPPWPPYLGHRHSSMLFLGDGILCCPGPCPHVPHLPTHSSYLPSSVYVKPCPLARQPRPIPDPLVGFVGVSSLQPAS